MVGNLATYILSIESRPDRASYAVAHLRERGFDPQVFYGVDARQKGWEEKVRVWEERKGLLHPAQICCAQSHLNLWRWILDEGEPLAFVVEDDISLTGDADLVTGLVDELPRDGWEIAMLSSYPLEPGEYYGPEHPSYFESANFLRAKLLEYGLHGYLISRSGCEYFISASSPIWTPIDCVTRFRASHIRAFQMKLPIAFQNGEMGSSIPAFPR